jgi:polar amino acid transport system ATP-binding protein
MAPLLRVEGVRKSYGHKLVLDGVDVTVDRHDVVCLIGPSGCGKSTLLRCINLLDPVDGGRIVFDGDVVTGRRVDATAVRKRMAIVFQSFNLFPHLTVLDNVTLGLRKAHGVPRRQADERARELLGRLGLAEKAGEYPERLSGGQQQRAAIARALVVEPELVLLDEVTSALDPELVGEVLATIRELAGAGMTLLIATHEMGFARDVADTVCFLHAGRVLEAGPPAQLLADPSHERTRQFLRRVIDAGRL